jgi:oligosaccharide reducing-end xylanase
MGGAAGVAGVAGAAGSAGAAGVGGATVPPPEVLHPVTGPASYPNPLRDVLGQTQTAINQKIQSVFNQLFVKGDPNTQAIYVAVGTDQGYVLDVLHNQIRTEGQGLGMMIAVQLNQRTIFDSLWRYAKAKLQVSDGATAGYFNSFCDSADQSMSSGCLDPFGFEQFVTALIFAHDRWGSAGALDYQADALALYHIMRANAPGADAGTGAPSFDPAINLP